MPPFNADIRGALHKGLLCGHGELSYFNKAMALACSKAS
jgi:hypothetical protein|tara:strand:+ start:342 stop:458 length:117 start_codon:yes stop_codon:yes gene_type:complete